MTNREIPFPYCALQQIVGSWNLAKQLCFKPLATHVMWYKKPFISTSTIGLCPTYTDVTNHPNDCCKLSVPCLVDFFTLCGHGIEEGLETVSIGLVDWWLNLWFCIDDWSNVFVAWLNVSDVNYKVQVLVLTNLIVPSISL
jgi:hypothetical protein